MRSMPGFDTIDKSVPHRKGQNMTTDQLKYFFEVAHTLSFSQAARNLYISQPNLTKYIANLEKELGFRLFDRSTHHCRLTEEGQDFLRRTEDLFYRLNSHIEDAKMLAQNPYTLISIGNARAELAPRPMMGLISKRNASDPKIRYVISEGSYTDLIEGLHTRKYDLIITTDKNARHAPDFDHLLLRPFEMLLAIHEDNPKAQLPNLHPSMCTDEVTFMTIPDGKNAPVTQIEETYRRCGANLNLRILNSPAELLLNTQSRAGVAIIPSTLALHRYDDLVFYRYEKPRSTYQALLWRKDEMRPEVLDLIEEIRKQAPYEEPDQSRILGETADITERL